MSPHQFRHSRFAERASQSRSTTLTRSSHIIYIQNAWINSKNRRCAGDHMSNCTTTSREPARGLMAVRPSLLYRYRRPQHHENRTEHNDCLVEGQLRKEAAIGADTRKNADVEHRRDDVVCRRSCSERIARNHGTRIVRELLSFARQRADRCSRCFRQL